MRQETIRFLERRRLLVAASLFTNLAVLVLFVLLERPGLGIAHGFYVSIALLAIATGPLVGALGGVLATGLFAIAVVVNPHVPPADIPTEATAIRLVTFVVVGVVVGYFASASRTLVAGANELMAELVILAERDFLTGLPNQRAFQGKIDSFLHRREPFVLLIGETAALERLSHGGNKRDREDLLLDFAGTLVRAAGESADVSRTGNEQFGVLARCPSRSEAPQIADRLERALARNEHSVTFGWATYPYDGDNALALFTAASDRLYARKIGRAEPRSLPVTAGVVQQLRSRYQDVR